MKGFSRDAPTTVAFVFAGVHEGEEVSPNSLYPRHPTNVAKRFYYIFNITNNLTIS
jgi:hypothetical protein